MHYDVFNGDADGIISLLQLRLAEPKNSVLITGVKRDISLLQQVAAQTGDSITVLDLSMEKNIKSLKHVLAAGVRVEYFDHHRAGQIPSHPALSSCIDLSPKICTALLVDQKLNGQYHLWAITAAYGDNLIATADQLAKQAGLTPEQATQLNNLGVLINYNSYGAQVSDLHFAPDQLFQTLLPYTDPFAVIADPQSPYHQLNSAYQADLAKAQAVAPLFENAVVSVYLLGDEPWGRRISGVFGNERANQAPERAHAVLTINDDGSYLVSVRAPLNNKTGADEICSAFPTGGGRTGAAGINQLAIKQLDQFINRLTAYYQQ